MDCWYSRYSGVTALLLATTSAAPTMLDGAAIQVDRVINATELECQRLGLIPGGAIHTPDTL
jgi:hypothetical protein